MRWLALLTPFLLLLNEADHARSLIIRQDFDLGPCNDVCSGVIGEIEFIQNSTLCTNANVQQFAKCLDCAFLAEGDTSEQAVINAQSGLDSYVQGCQDNGFAVQSVTVTSGSGSTGTAALAPPPASESSSPQPDQNGAISTTTMRWGAAQALALALGILGFAVLA